jgi:hypothetical protein
MLKRVRIVGKAKSFAERYRDLSRNDPAFRGASFIFVGLAALFVMGPVVSHVATLVLYYVPIEQGCTELYQYMYDPILGEIKIDLGVCVPNIVWLEEIQTAMIPITGLAGAILGW